MNLLTEKVAIVTGAGRGIGKAVSIALARAGSRVVLAARNEAELEAVQEVIRRDGGDAIVISTDLDQDGAAEHLINKTLSEWGTIDYLINNAGWGKMVSVLKGKVEDWDKTLKINLRAPMLLSRLVLPTMIGKKNGAIINISSVSGKTGHANGAAYCASKFGLLGFTQSLFEEVREYGIRVATILPGFVNTPMIPHSAKLNRSKMIQPEDVAAAIIFALTCPPTACPVEITVRPQQTPYL